MYFGQNPSEIQSAKMVLCEAELRRIRSGKLKGMSFETTLGFKCVQSLHGNKRNLGTFKTIEACNAAWDNFDLEREISNLKQRLRTKGYQKTVRGDTVRYIVKMAKGFRSLDCEKKARAAYVEIIEAQINELKSKIKPIDKSDLVKG
jgi:DNA-binding Xre family transcriptional regulator